MKKIFPIFVLVFLLLPAAVFAKGDKKNKAGKEAEKNVYVWGASFSFTDSVVYFTEIQHVEGVTLKDKLLPNRHMYSYELKDYMSFEENMPGRTSFIFFSEKRSKLEKKEKKIKKRLVEQEGKTVRYLGDKFKFTKH